jgi:hypothetical protein
VRGADSESAGHADLAVQGYYLGTSGAPLAPATGLSIRFLQFIPRLGLLSGSIEGLGVGRSLEFGENYLELRDALWGARRWSIGGGDLRIPTVVFENRFPNVIYPELMVRGFRIKAANSSSEYAVYYGAVTLQQGPRLPFRVRIPQTVTGATARFQLNPRLVVGIRWQRFANDPARLQQFFYSPFLRNLAQADSGAVQASYTIRSNLTAVAETSLSAGVWTAAGPQRQSAGSLFAGLSWDTKPVTARVNYQDQSALAMPLAGYFFGDRRGPYADVRVRPLKAVELFASASGYANNRAGDPEVPTFRGTNRSLGGSVSLPGNLTTTLQVADLSYSAQSGDGTPERRVENRQTSLAVAKLVGRHSIRLTGRDFTLKPDAQQQRSLEAEDLMQWRRMALGGAVRFQRSRNSELRDTMFYRGSGQVRFGRLNLFAQVELGNDLANQSVFATNGYSTSVAGASLRLPGDWQLESDVFRTRLLFTLNPENAFILGTRGVVVPATLSDFNQWSVFFRLSKQLHWGRGAPAGGDLAQYAIRQRPLTGTIEGFVHRSLLSGRQPVAAGIPVMLDGSSTELTDSDGRFRFTNVSEGQHNVNLSPELPAEFDPATDGALKVVVRAGRVSRADLDVFPLTSISGSVTGPSDVLKENLFVRLLPTTRYTSTDAGGNFAFYNVREGEYRLVLDAASLPTGIAIEGAGEIAVQVRVADKPASVEFRVYPVDRAKPVRKVLQRLE